MHRATRNTTFDRLRITASSLGIGLIGACATPGYTPGVSLMGGVRKAEIEEASTDELDIEQPTVGGLALEWTRDSGGLGFELGGFYALDSNEIAPGVEAEAATTEGYAGVRYDFGPRASRVRPYVGLGVAYLESELSLDGPGSGDSSIDGDSPGAYAHAGILFAIGDHFGLGFDVRGVFGTDAEFAPGVSVDIDYTQATGFLKFSF